MSTSTLFGGLCRLSGRLSVGRQTYMRHALASLSTSSMLLSGSKQEQDDLFSKIYELRTYNVWPSQVKAFKDLSEEWLPVRRKYSNLLGYWTTEIGAGINQMVHIWEYDSLSHRGQVRKNLANDKEWNSNFVSKSFPCLSSQENCLLELTHAYPAMVKEKPDGDTYYYALLSIEGSFDGSIKDNPPVSRIIGCYRTLIGNLNKEYVLIQMETVDAIIDVSKMWKQNHQQKRSDTKLLLPCSWSPLQ